MTKNVYNPPSSDITAGLDGGDTLHRARKCTVLAFLAAPLVTSLVVVGLILIIDGISGADLEFIGKVFLKYLLLTYALTFIIGLPIHWILGRFNKRKFYIYVSLGIAIPAPAVFLSGETKSSVVWIISVGLGITWSVIFWLIAVYINERKTLIQAHAERPPKGCA